jgi:hypothetical protein
MPNLLRIPFCALLLAFGALNASAHGGDHSQITVPDDADWATRHMAGERFGIFSR